MEEEEEHNKFAHLLQPIRDLAENWNIDIASELESYLAELEEITFSFDGSSKTLNFAEAALLIQGSACIYSKKVEYLYQLLYRTLDLIVAKKKKKEQSNSINADGEDTDAAFEKEEEFLLLDDIEVAESIDLVEGHEHRRDAHDQRGREKRNMEMLLYRHMNDDDRVRSNTDSSDFYLNSSSLSKSGALLLYNNHSITEASQNSTTSLNNASLPSRHSTARVSFAPDPQLESSEAMDSNLVEFQPHSDDDDDDGMERCDADIQLPTSEQLNDTGVENGNATKTRRRQSLVYEEDDDWSLLNPHEEVPKLIKPFKKGKPYRIPKKDAVAKQQQPENSLAEVEFKKYPFKKPYFPELDYFYQRVTKLKQASRLKFRQAMQKSFGRRVTFEHEIEPEEGEEEEEDQRLEFEHFGGGGADESDDEAVEPIPLDPVEENTEIVVQDPTSYEDMCRAQVEAYLSSVQNYVEESLLSQRVSEWKQKLAPLLSEQESRPSFDIHNYCHSILNAFSKENEELSFSEIVAGDSTYNVCRRFVSALQLINNGNLEIQSTSENIYFKLNNRTMRDISDYRAPSMASPVTKTTKAATGSKKKRTRNDKENVENQQVLVN